MCVSCSLDVKAHLDAQQMNAPQTLDEVARLSHEVHVLTNRSLEAIENLPFLLKRQRERMTLPEKDKEKASSPT